MKTSILIIVILLSICIEDTGFSLNYKYTIGTMECSDFCNIDDSAFVENTCSSIDSNKDTHFICSKQELGEVNLVKHVFHPPR